MTLFTPEYLAFLAILLLALALIRAERARQIVLLVASLFFYATWSVWYLCLVIGCIVVVHFSARLLTRLEREGSVLAVSIILLLGVLGIFKYAGLGIALPAGISFFTFSAIGYLIDVYRGEFEERIPFLDEALYILFFPKLLQGPLEKATDFFAQLKSPHPIRRENLSAGVQMFLTGLVKKMVIADRLGLFVDTVYRTPKAFDGPTLLLAAISYTIQIYCDFSGYTDLAVGTAKMLGYDLVPNFNLPFLSKNVSEYWRRWHISLNIWFRDYLFYPILRSKWMGKIRRGLKSRGVSKKWVNIAPSLIGMMIVWPLVGLWHGAALNYVIYGLLYGLMMMFSLAVDTFRKKKIETPFFNFLRIVRTYIITLFLYILFRAPDFSTMGIILKGIFTWQSGVKYYYTWSFIYIPLVFAASIYAYRKNEGNSFYIKLNMTKFWSMVAFWVVAFSIVAFMYIGETYFIYLQF